MPFLAGGLALLMALLLLRGFAAASPAMIRTVLAWLAASLGAVAIVLLVIAGREGLVIWAASLFGPLLWRWWQGRRAAAQFGTAPAGAGASSAVDTATLHLELDHGTGRMTGQVRRGRFAGRELQGMTRAELLALLADCAEADSESMPLLEAWLDRAHPDWRDAEDAGPAPNQPGGMSAETARSLLGVSEGADARTIWAAHRRLMARAHPDRGGDHAFAARLNQARDVLLRS